MSQIERLFDPGAAAVDHVEAAFCAVAVDTVL